MKGISCPICATAAQSTDDPIVPGIVCPRCGEFRYEPNDWSGPKTVWDKVRLSGWVRDQNDADATPHFTRELANRIKTKPIPGLKDRSSRLLKYLATKKTRPTAFFMHEEVSKDREMLGRTYSADAEDALPPMMLLREEKFIGNEDGAPGSFQLSIAGILEAEQLASTFSPHAQGFVAMSFSESMKPAWAHGFAPAIRAAGFRPFRIDAKDYTGGISDEIMTEIRRSRFVVADYTEQKHGVYFEAGFAMGLALPLVPTCRADDISKLHFDIRHLNTLTWKKPEDLVDALSKRIMAVIGAGPDII